MAVRGLTDFELIHRVDTHVFNRRVDTGGMFDSTALVAKDPVPCEKPYLAAVLGSFGGGRGRRHLTEDEAKKDLTRLMMDEFGVEIDF